LLEKQDITLLIDENVDARGNVTPITGKQLGGKGGRGFRSRLGDSAMY